MSNRGEKLLRDIRTPILRQTERGRAWYVGIVDSAKQALTMLNTGRLALSIMLILWLAVMTFYIRYRNDPEDPEAHQRYFAIHRVWFGEQSIVMILWRMWYTVLVIGMVSPLVKEILFLLQL